MGRYRKNFSKELQRRVAVALAKWMINDLLSKIKEFKQ